MKVKNKKSIRKALDFSQCTEMVNQEIGMQLILPMSTDEIRFTNIAQVKYSAIDFLNCMNQEGLHYSDDEGMMMAMLQMAFDFFNDIQPVIINEILKESRIFHKGEIEANAYFKNIHFKNEKAGRFELSHGSFGKYELMIYDVPKRTNDGLLIPKIGAFDHRFEYPAILEDGFTWMSVTPNEIFTMQKSIEEASGNVLTLGLGLGYWAYMVSEKPNVEHVTIVEKEPEVIELFEKNILPQFANRDKISVIQADAFEYMDKLEDGRFDYCFADIWTGNTDAEPYLRLKKLCRKFSQTRMSYWIEESIVETVIGYVNMIIRDELYHSRISKIPASFGKEKYTIDCLKEVLDGISIEKAEDVFYCMEPKNIISLL